MAIFNQTKKPLPVTPVPAAAAGSQSSVVGKTLLIKGEIYSDDEILIEGKIQGKINVKNRVIVGINGNVEADIDAREVVIKGKVIGNVKGSQRVEIVPAGVLRGNINSPRVVIADSGIFEGNIEMHGREEKSKGREDIPAVAQQPHKGTGEAAQPSENSEHPNPYTKIKK
jgi:cytoskeletal protein CcmA (bactofilin family)